MIGDKGTRSLRSKVDRAKCLTERAIWYGQAYRTAPIRRYYCHLVSSTCHGFPFEPPSAMRVAEEEDGEDANHSPATLQWPLEDTRCKPVSTSRH